MTDWRCAARLDSRDEVAVSGQGATRVLRELRVEVGLGPEFFDDV